MKNSDEVEALEKLIGQLDAVYKEVGALARKNPNDSLSDFKLSMINNILASGSDILGERYKPFPDFELLDSDDVPTNGDAAFVIAQYISEAERFRSDNVAMVSGRWFYVVAGETSSIPSGPPWKIGRKQ